MTTSTKTKTTTAAVRLTPAQAAIVSENVELAYGHRAMGGWRETRPQDADDVAQAAAEALCKQTARWNPAIARLSTYADDAIVHAMKREAREAASPIRRTEWAMRQYSAALAAGESIDMPGLLTCEPYEDWAEAMADVSTDDGDARHVDAEHLAALRAEARITERDWAIFTSVTLSAHDEDITNEVIADRMAMEGYTAPSGKPMTAQRIGQIAREVAAKMRAASGPVAA